MNGVGNVEKGRKGTGKRNMQQEVLHNCYFLQFILHLIFSFISKVVLLTDSKKYTGSN